MAVDMSGHRLEKLAGDMGGFDCPRNLRIRDGAILARPDDSEVARHYELVGIGSHVIRKPASLRWMGIVSDMGGDGHVAKEMHGLSDASPGFREIFPGLFTPDSLFEGVLAFLPTVWVVGM